MKPKKSRGSKTCFDEKGIGTRESGFEKGLRGLMRDYGKDLEDIIDIIGYDPVPGQTSRLCTKGGHIYRQTRGVHPAKKGSSGKESLYRSNPKFRAGKGMQLRRDTLLDLCPELLKLDDDQGHTMFRDFISHVDFEDVVFDWAQHLILYRWLTKSRYAESLESEHLEAVMAAAVSLWCESDLSDAQGIILIHPDSALPVTGWKGSYSGDQTCLSVREGEIRGHSDFAFCVCLDSTALTPRKFVGL